METTKTVLAPGERITVIDALRGFSLIGICLIHSMQHFGAMGTMTSQAVFPWEGTMNEIFSWLINYLVFGKFFIIFSCLFGLSFFIQMDRAAKKGLDFRPRFLWRLVLLLAIGYLHGLIVRVDILLIYAILGFVLVLMYKWPTKLLAGTKLLIGSSSAKKKVTAASAYDYIVDLGTMLSKKKVPKVNRFVTVNADYLGLLSKDKRFTANPKVLEKGVVEGQTINGMQVMCSEELPANVIIANHKSAIGAAKQINEVEAMRLQNKFADGIRGLCVYGDKVLRDDASAALYFEVGTAADADPINVKITNDTKSPVNTKEVSA